MGKNSEQNQEFSMQQAMKLAQSDAGQQLFSLLQSTEGDKLQSAMDHAAAGNMEQVKQTMQQLMQSAQVQDLIRKMRGENDG